MPKSKSNIQDEVFKDFEKTLNVFYRRRQQRYFSELKEKIESGLVDPEEISYREVAHQEAEKFMKTRVQELTLFIKEYVDNGIDDIKRGLDNKEIDKKEADIRFEVLKYILLAGENEQNK